MYSAGLPAKTVTKRDSPKLETLDTRETPVYVQLMVTNLGVELEEGDRVEAVLVRTRKGHLAVRELCGNTQPDWPQFFKLESVTVVTDEDDRDTCVKICKGEKLESLDMTQCIVPANWPRNVIVSATVYLGPAGSLVLHEPQCATCQGRGSSPFAPDGWSGGLCPICEGTGEYKTNETP